MNPRPNFTFDSNTPRGEIRSILNNAREHIETLKLNATGKSVLRACIQYANDNFISLIRTADFTRYTTISRILNASLVYDDIHFLAYAIRELETIGAYENSSLRNNTLPIARRNLDALLAPAVLRTQRAFMGAMTAGLGLLSTRVAPVEGRH